MAFIFSFANNSTVIKGTTTTANVVSGTSIECASVGTVAPGNICSGGSGSVASIIPLF
jgi:hypothetical protein